MPFTPTRDLPKPEDYLRYFDAIAKETKFIKLVDRRGPISYPYRMPAVAAGSKGDAITFDEINPSETKNHVYVAYLGLCKGFLFYLWHQRSRNRNRLGHHIGGTYQGQSPSAFRLEFSLVLSR